MIKYMRILSINEKSNGTVDCQNGIKVKLMFQARAVLPFLLSIPLLFLETSVFLSCYFGSPVSQFK